MKKILSALLMLILAFTLSLSLVACGNNDDDGDTADDGDDSEVNTGFHELDFELSSNGKYYIVSGWGVHLEKEVVIPAEHNGKPVREIKSSCFAKSNLAKENMQKITLPDTIEKIDSFAFQGCANLTSITFGSGLVEIGDYAFQGCTSLKSIKLNEGLVRINDGAFMNCADLETIALPESLTSIGMYAFEGCTTFFENESNVKNGIVFARVKTSNGMLCWAISAIDPFMSYATLYGSTQNTVGIIDGLFAHNENLGTVYLPNSIKYIGKDAFEGCNNIHTVYCEADTWADIEFADGNEYLESLTPQLFNAASSNQQ